MTSHCHSRTALLARTAAGKLASQETDRARAALPRLRSAPHSSIFASPDGVRRKHTSPSLTRCIGERKGSSLGINSSSPAACRAYSTGRTWQALQHCIRYNGPRCTCSHSNKQRYRREEQPGVPPR
ncbi:hypothetical protein E2C01_100485 [Portunus trituberculatus]|uniref:Uncharacterized protein n=1 Tax=Portunus trituberculatus TaxID=210409 RepID=A0A5B7KHP2_PORTR|nr:hypothetical protein [Portunus trituberculatus]